MPKNLLNCGHRPEVIPYLPGFFTDTKGKTSCYSCCCEREKEALRSVRQGQWTLLHLAYDEGRDEPFNPLSQPFCVTDWTGCLVLEVNRSKTHVRQTGFSDQRVFRLDVWFEFEGRRFWGFNVGEDNGDLHVRRLKEASKPHRRHLPHPDGKTSHSQ